MDSSNINSNQEYTASSFFSYYREKRPEKFSDTVETYDIPLTKELFEQHQVNYQSQEKVTRKITKLDLYEYGFSGTDNSGQKRARLLSVLKLPSHLSANALIPVLNALMSYEEFQKLAQTIE